MKKFALSFIIFCLILAAFPGSIYASVGLIKPNSGLYFLQTWGEDLKLFFTFSKDQKISYLLSLTQRRVDEMAIDPSAKISERYAQHFQDLSDLSSQVSDKSAVVEKIKDASLSQQSVLAAVYTKVPDAAKSAVLGAQENSSKHVANTIQAVEGEKSANTYAAQTQAIQKAEQIGKVEQVEMESEPNPNPSENNIKQINTGQGLNQLNSINQNGTGGGGMQPAAPVPMK